MSQKIKVLDRLNFNYFRFYVLFSNIFDKIPNHGVSEFINILKKKEDPVLTMNFFTHL